MGDEIYVDVGQMGDIGSQLSQLKASIRTTAQALVQIKGKICDVYQDESQVEFDAEFSDGIAEIYALAESVGSIATIAAQVSSEYSEAVNAVLASI